MVESTFIPKIEAACRRKKACSTQAKGSMLSALSLRGPF